MQIKIKYNFGVAAFKIEFFATIADGLKLPTIDKRSLNISCLKV